MDQLDVGFMRDPLIELLHDPFKGENVPSDQYRTIRFDFSKVIHGWE